MKKISDSQESISERQIVPTKTKLPKKIKIDQKNDEKATKKSKSDPFVQMCQKILRQREKLKNHIFESQCQQQDEVAKQASDIFQIDPHIKQGIIQNYQQTTQSQKQQFNLSSQGKCQHFTFLNQYLIVLVGRLPTSYSNNLQISLYLPKQMIQNQLPYVNGLQLVVIKRLGKNGDNNYLNYPFIVVQPNKLLYPSYLCSWIDCKRRVSLVNYISTQLQVNQAMVFGSACHKYMELLIEKSVGIDYSSYNQFKQTIYQIYKSFLYDMYLIKAQFQTFFQYCEQSLQNIRTWVKNHLINHRQIEINKYQKTYLVIEQMVGCQTMHRSKYFGLKGKLDCLFKGTLIDRQKQTRTQVYIPYQLKTGKKISESHKRQTDIYNILVRQKYKKPVVGLLYYSNDNLSIFRIQNVQTCFENIIIHRNTIVMNLSKLFKTDKINLPAFTSNMDSCKFCNMANACQVSYISDKIEEQVTNQYKIKYMIKSNHKSNAINQPQNHGNQVIFDSEDEVDVPSKFNVDAKINIDKITAKQMQYLRKWMKWLHYQQRQSKISLQTQQRSGFQSFKIKLSQIKRIKQVKQTQRLVFWIQKQMKSIQKLNQIFSFYQPSHKMRILINPLNLIQSCKILSTKKEKNIFLMQIELNNKNIPLNQSALSYSIQNSVQHDVELEKFQNNHFSNLRNTVFKFIMNGNQRLKDLVLVNQRKTQVKYQKLNEASQDTLKTTQASSNALISINQDNNQIKKTSQQIQITKQDIQNLNENQQQAFKKIFTLNQHCTLVEGMPGTGKTQLIVRLIQKCNQLNWKVLITTFTNRSLDNILQRTLKFQQINLNKIIRQGSRYSIDEKFQKLNSRTQKFEQIQDYHTYFESKLFWFVTLSSMGIHHIPQKFDLVILDQASQSLQPSCIQALSKGNRIVLIGDYKQLQPIVKSKRSQSQGMCISLFQRLCLRYPQKMVSLRLQYRMNKQIMKISNQLVYQHQLIAGSNQVGNKFLILKDNWKLQCEQETLIKLIDPQRSIVFLNHDGITNSLTAKYRNEKDQIANIIEVQVSAYLLQKLIQLNVAKNDITIVCGYNRTVDQITTLLKSSFLQKQKLQSQVLTIDKSQGIDKQVIILITENRNNNILLQNCRRLNVALTRAKSKLIVIGSKKFLADMDVWQGGLSSILGKYQLDITKGLIDHILNQFKAKSIQQH